MPMALICTTLIDLETQATVDAEMNLYIRHGFTTKRVLLPRTLIFQ